jgi:hypothetical protein
MAQDMYVVHSTSDGVYSDPMTKVEADRVAKRWRQDARSVRVEKVQSEQTTSLRQTAQVLADFFQEHGYLTQLSTSPRGRWVSVHLRSGRETKSKGRVPWGAPLGELIVEEDELTIQGPHANKLAALLDTKYHDGRTFDCGDTRFTCVRQR